MHVNARWFISDMAAGSPWFVPWLMLSALGVFGVDATKAEYDLSDPEICNAEKYIINLFHGQKAQVVLFFDGSNLAAPLTTRGIFKCNAEVHAPPGHHVGVVVYEMNLRRRGGGCADSIAFLEDAPLLPDKVRDVLWGGSGKICGNLTNARNLKVEPMNPDDKSGLLGSFYVQRARMDVKFRLDGSIPSEYKQTNFRAVVTAYLTGPCQPQYFLCGADVCISKVLTCNGIPNCGFHTGFPGVDEVNCTDGSGYVPGKIRLDEDAQPKNQTSKLAVWIGVFAGAILSFALVSLVCMWRARRNGPMPRTRLGIMRTRRSRPGRTTQSRVAAEDRSRDDSFNRGQQSTNAWEGIASRSVNISAHDFPPNMCVRYNTTTERIDVFETEEEAELAAKNDLPPPSYDSLFDRQNVHDVNEASDPHVEPPSYHVVAASAVEENVAQNGGNSAP